MKYELTALEAGLIHAKRRSMIASLMALSRASVSECHALLLMYLEEQPEPGYFRVRAIADNVNDTIFDVDHYNEVSISEVYAHNDMRAALFELEWFSPFMPAYVVATEHEDYDGKSASIERIVSPAPPRKFFENMRQGNMGTALLCATYYLYATWAVARANGYRLSHEIGLMLDAGDTANPEYSKKVIASGRVGITTKETFSSIYMLTLAFSAFNSHNHYEWAAVPCLLACEGLKYDEDYSTYSVISENLQTLELSLHDRGVKVPYNLTSIPALSTSRSTAQDILRHLQSWHNTPLDTSNV